MIGTTVSHYRIVKALGRGGMGEVYQAEDQRLRREVALKFLPERLARDQEAMQRFRREARAASILNHPNICTIFEIDQFRGRPFIAMELLEGSTLRQKLADGFDARQMVDIAIQVANGLEAAHSKGIIHRDIKSANIVISAGGHVKILDFGLAKFLPQYDPKPSGPVTRTYFAEDITTPGGPIGTATYMSPEQARGDELDLRTDLFSFGVVLYEMATGRVPFEGQTIAVLFEAILNKSPAALTEVNPQVPKPFESIVLRLLQKDRAARYQTAAAVRQDLQDFKDGLFIKPARHRPTGTNRLRKAIAVGAGVALAGLAAFLASRFAVAPPERTATSTFTQLTAHPGRELFPTLSPDGRFFAFVQQVDGNWDIFLQRVGGQNPTNLTPDSKVDDTQPAFSRDGDRIAFRSERDGGGIFVMGATGESVRRVSETGYNPSWSPDGKQIVVASEPFTDNPGFRNVTSALTIIDVASGAKRQIRAPDAVQPHWSPPGNRIAYWAATNSGQRDVWTVATDGSAPVQLTDRAGLNWNPTWSPDGRLLYFSSDRDGAGNLWRIPIDEKSGKATGSPEPVTTGGGSTLRQHAAISADGARIAYVEQTVIENLVKIPFDSVARKVTGPPVPLTRGSRRVHSPHPSADGTMLAFQSYGVREDIYVIRSDGTGERQLTNDEFRDRIPRWSPDGRTIAFYSNRGGSFDIWTIEADGSNLRQITNDGAADVRAVWSPDGKQLAGYRFNQNGFILDFTSSPPRETPITGFENADAHFLPWSWSLDGKWLAGENYSTSSGNITGLFLYSLADRTYHALTDFGISPTWLNDNQRLMVLTRGKLVIVSRTGKHEEIASLPAEEIFQFALDGRFIYLITRTQESDVWLMTNSADGRLTK